MQHVHPPSAHFAGEPQREPRPQTWRLVQCRNRPAARLDIRGQTSATPHRHESEVEQPTVGVARKFDQQLFHPAHVQLPHNVEHAHALWCPWGNTARHRNRPRSAETH